MRIDSPAARTRLPADSRDLLPDGSNLAELVSLQQRTVSARAMTDADIYRLELERIFDKIWVFVGHESEIPNPGDFVTRFIGEDPVIVTRDRDGGINVLLNVCSHRGAQVCRGERGTVRAFQCPYHNWLYDAKGELIGVPAEKHAYPGGLDRTALGLKRARVGVAHGLVFATWNENAPSLEEHYGAMDFYYKMFFGLTDNGFEVAGPPLRWVENSNWKFPTENLSGDGYHLMYVHRFLDDLNLIPGWGNPAMAAGVTSVCEPGTGDGFQLGNFEMAQGATAAERLATSAALYGLTPEFAAQIERNLSPEQLSIFINGVSLAGNIFPALSYTALPWPSCDENAGFGGFGFQRLLRMTQPLGPDRHVVWMWTLVAKDLPAEMKDLHRLTTMRSFSVAGVVESDDGEVLMRAQRAIGGVQGRQRSFCYYSNRPANTDWPGPGTARTSFPDEENQLNFWVGWLTLMTDPKA
jgi:PAH dioxygenase large subunit